MSVGVYAVVNEETGLIIYIGSSTILEERWRIHCRELKKGVSLHKNMQEIYNRLGRRGLSFEILEETSLEDRFKVEKYFVSLYQPIDNIFYTERQLAVNEKISKALKGKISDPVAIEKTRQTNIGRVRSEELRNRWSEQRKGRKPSEETRAKMSESQRQRWAERKNSL